MEIIYKIIGGGQQVKQNVEYNKETYYEVCENSNYPQKSKAGGQNNYTNVMWNVDFERLQHWANEWGKKEIKLLKKN